MNNRKKYEKIIKDYLISLGRYKKTHDQSISILAEAYNARDFAIREIDRKNDKNFGSGYIQTIGTNGYENLSVEFLILRECETKINKMHRLFGFDPLSEKQLDPKAKSLENPVMRMLKNSKKVG